MKKSVFLISCLIFLSACISNPISAAFRNNTAPQMQEAAKNRVNLGLTYLDVGDFPQAKSNFDQALAFDRGSSEAHSAIASYYRQTNQVDLAENHYEIALSLSDNAPDISNAYGVFLCQQGHYEKAKTYLLEAVKIENHAETAEYYENLALCSQSHGDIASAIDYFYAALNLQPTRPSTLFMLSHLFMQKSDWENAKKTLKRYERSAPETAETLYLNYKIATGLGDVSAARGYGEALLAKHPSDDNTNKFIAEITELDAPSNNVSRDNNQITSTKNTTPQLEQEYPASFKHDNSSRVSDVASQISVVNDKDTSKSVTNDSPSNTTETIEIETIDDGWHVVQRKENLFRISKRYNVTIAQLMEWNGLTDASSIQMGAKMRIAEPSDVN